MEDILLFGNILLLDNAMPPRKYRERLLTIDELTDKELPSRYRFGRQSIEIIIVVYCKVEGRLFCIFIR